MRYKQSHETSRGEASPGCQRRRTIIEEFFCAYQNALRHNKVFLDTEQHGIAEPPAVPPVPRCIAVLELPWPCTLQDVKRAFRTKAKAAHPDAGGNSEAFQSLHESYKEALTLVD